MVNKIPSHVPCGIGPFHGVTQDGHAEHAGQVLGNARSAAFGVVEVAGRSFECEMAGGLGGDGREEGAVVAHALGIGSIIMEEIQFLFLGRCGLGVLGQHAEEGGGAGLLGANDEQARGHVGANALERTPQEVGAGHAGGLLALGTSAGWLLQGSCRRR